MLTSFPVCIIAGLLLGYLAGIGVGGGSLLILWLTLVLHTEPGTAKTINLMFFLASASAATLLRWKKGQLQFQSLLPAIIGGCIGALLFSWISTKLNSDTLKPFFGILLIGTGLRELFYRPRKAR